MSRAELSLEDVSKAAQSLLPDGWTASAQYSIDTDAIPIQITTPNRLHYATVDGLDAGDLYFSLDGLIEKLKPLVEPAVAQIQSMRVP